MKTIYLFDVDGTLTPARKQMEMGFRNFFSKFCEEFPVYFVTGSDRPKLDEQLPIDIRNAAQGIFTCAGTEFWRKADLVDQRHHEFDKELISTLERIIDLSPYKGRYGKHFEFRTGMVNVSIPGRNIPREGREAYYHWDRAYGERQAIIKSLARFFPEYTVAAGGQISVDVCPKGWTKAQVLTRLKTWHPDCRFVFFGDKMGADGNDRPLADVIWADSADNQAISVEDPQQTQTMLEAIYRPGHAEQLLELCA